MGQLPFTVTPYFFWCIKLNRIILFPSYLVQDASPRLMLFCGSFLRMVPSLCQCFEGSVVGEGGPCI